MTMMISRFHRLIQSRILWGVFLIVIVFSFVIWGMVWPSREDRLEEARGAGTLDGETVSFGEYNAAYRSAYLARALTQSRDMNAPGSDVILRRMTWQRLATLREAAKLDLTASDDELRSAIRANFSDTNHVYSPQYYQMFLQNVVHPLNYSTAQFERHIREEIVLQKLGLLIGRQAFVTPLEVQRTINTLLDTFTVEYVHLTAEEAAKEVKVTTADARKLFDANPEAFMLPEHRQVTYVAFPIANYLVTTNVPEDTEIQDYYELHIDDFTKTETSEDGESREIIADLDDVRDDIVKVLQHEAAVFQAEAAASELALRSIPDRDGVVPDFAQEAEKSGLTATPLPPFALTDKPVEEDGAPFAAATFELEQNPYDRLSHPIAGENNVYLIYLDKVIAPRVPDFDEAKDQAREAARKAAVRDALSSRAEAVQQAASAGLAAGKTFAQALADQQVTVETVEPFSGLTGASSTNEVVLHLVQAVTGYNAGEVTEPIPFAGDVLVAYVQEREVADDATVDAYRGEIASAVRGHRAQTLFADWQSALLAPERFTDSMSASDVDDDEMDDAPFADEDYEM